MMTYGSAACFSERLAFPQIARPEEPIANCVSDKIV
jgi:hypothetical protein